MWLVHLGCQRVFRVIYKKIKSKQRLGKPIICLLESLYAIILNVHFLLSKLLPKQLLFSGMFFSGDISRSDLAALLHCFFVRVLAT